MKIRAISAATASGASGRGPGGHGRTARGAAKDHRARRRANATAHSSSRACSASGERDPGGLVRSIARFQPDNLELLLARADLDLQLGRPAAAVERMEARVARSPADESVTSPALEFFLSHHLDEAAERRLQADAARQPGADDPQLALAKFLFAQHKPPRRVPLLEALAARPGDPAVRAARLLRFADCLQGAEQPRRCPALLASRRRTPAPRPRRCSPRATRCWPGATWPGRAPPWSARGRRPPPARSAWKSNANFSRPCKPPTRSRARRCRLAGRGASGMPRSLRRVFLPAHGPALPARGSLPISCSPDGTALARYLGRIAQTAKPSRTPQTTSGSRAGRSGRTIFRRRYGRGNRGADRSARLALPRMLASLAVEGRQHEVAERWLREIMAIDPSRRAACLSRSPTASSTKGTSIRAPMFVDLQHAAPGSVAALTDLALAHQRADRWFDALAAWERAYAVPGATPSQRAEVRRPLLVALDELDQSLARRRDSANGHRRAARHGCEAGPFPRTDRVLPTARVGRSLRKIYEGRLKAQPQDYFLLTALAEIAPGSRA